jgi:AbrB family looped-hinge helix DNA binding protein
VRITSRGQVTIPKHLREAAGLLPNTEVTFELDGSAVRIEKARRPRAPVHGKLVVATLRRGRPHLNMTTDEIMALTRGE